MRRNLTNVAILLICAGAMALTYCGGKVIKTSLLTTFIWLIPTAIFLLRFRNDDAKKGSDKESSFRVALLFLVLFLISSTAKHKWFYFCRWTDWPDLGWHLDSGLMLFVLLTVLIAILISSIRELPRFLTLVCAIVTPVIVAAGFIYYTSGIALYNDDHASFIYRLYTSAHAYPGLVVYTPFWNGGWLYTNTVDNGIMPLTTIFLPLLRFADVTRMYTVVIALTYLILVPALAYISARIARLSITTGAVAAILSLGVSQTHFLWLLNYGTIGANFCAALVMPVMACVYRVIILKATDLKTAVALVLSVVFMMMWPPGAILACAIVAGFFFNFRSWDKRSFVFLLLCSAAILIIYSPFLVYMYRQTDVFQKDFTETALAHASLIAMVKNGIARTGDYLKEGHPIILFLGICGLIGLRYRKINWWYLPATAVMMIIAGWGPELAPDLQLHRMFTPVFYAAVIPAAYAVMLIYEQRTCLSPIYQAMIVALLILTGINVRLTYSGKGMVPFDTIPAVVTKIAHIANTSTPPTGRMLIAGETGHEYGGGHIGPLPLLAGREMLSAGVQHDQVRDIINGTPPVNPPADTNLFISYLDNYAVCSIVTTEEEWTRYLDSMPAKFSRIAQLGDTQKFFFYAVLKPTAITDPSVTKLTADLNKLNLVIANGCTNTVIKYNWIDGLKTIQPAEIYPAEGAFGSKLIGIRPNGAAHVSITFDRYL